jgi:hypothetical protein
VFRINDQSPGTDSTGRHDREELLPMRKAPIAILAALLAGTAGLTAPAPAIAAEQGAAEQAAAAPVGPPDGKGSHDALVTLFTTFTEWKTPKAVDGVVDYSPATVDKRRAELRTFQAKLPDFAVARKWTFRISRST